MQVNERVQLRLSTRKREIDSPISIKKNKSEKKNTMTNSKLNLEEKLKNDANSPIQIKKVTMESIRNKDKSKCNDTPSKFDDAPLNVVRFDR